MNFTEDQLRIWSGSPSQTEAEKMQHAEDAVKKALAASEKLRTKNTRVFAQGSYKNRVNVRSDSDVDIAILCTNTFLWDGPPDATLASLGYDAASYLYPEFRNDVGQALRSYFQSGSVTEGDKAFDVSGNTYRVEADVAPFFEYRLFLQTGGFLSGVAMRPLTGGKLVNWPDQHYENAVAKNQATQRAFKGCVRILKTARNRMIAGGYQSSTKVPSFLVECMTYNVPNHAFNHGTWTEDVRACLVSMFNQTGTQGDAGAMTEVSELKALFGTHQKWERERANAFIVDCWHYLGFE